MSKYLLEIGTEELPAKFSHAVLDQFKSLIEFELDKKLIKYKNIVVTSTPRRLVLLLEGLVDFAEDKTEVRKGPKASSAELALGPFLTSVLSSAKSTNPSRRRTNLLGVEVTTIFLYLINFLSNSNSIRDLN